MGACIRDVTGRLPSLVQFTNYYLLLVLHVATSDTARSSLRSIKKDDSPGSGGKGPLPPRAQVVFPSVLPVKGMGFQRVS